MSKGRRYSGEEHLNFKKVFAVLMAILVIILAIVIVKNIMIKAKNTKTVVGEEFFALYQDGKWGILSSNGEIVINPMYQEMPIVIDRNRDVFLCIYDINEDENTYKTKAINSKNEEIFTFYDQIEAIENYDKSGNLWYEENVLKVKKDGLWGLIDLDGNELTKIKYDEINSIKGIKNSLTTKENGLVGLVNNKGIKVLDTAYLNILNFGDDYKNGYITVNSENKYGLVNLTGDTILENKYEKIENIYADKYFVIKENTKEKLINKNKDEILISGFDEITQIVYSGIIFKINNKYGLMGYDGEIKIEPSYEYLEEINDDVFVATKDNKQGIIDKENNIKLDYNYAQIIYNKKANIYIADDEKYNSYIINSNFEIKLSGILSELNTDIGYMKLKQEDTYRYYNFKFEQKSVKDILSSNKLYISKQNDKYGYVDAKGKVVVEYIYDDVTELNRYGYAAVKKDGLWGSINSDGNVVIEPSYNLNDNLVIDFIGKWHLGLDLNMNYYCEK